MYIVINGPGGLDEIMELGDHIEIDHEREMPGYWKYKELEMAHSAMHRMCDNCSHWH